ncbi:MAG: PD-(D/E)XK nuclease family protein, partial [Oscillospiraceae bacterium]|nr:PD-(D/E)XK nuclease family protein [Oscillospiraceae bacterium]
PENAKAFDESGDTIKIMTIHQSKGLEFPVCFICDTSREINKRDVYASLLVDDELGIAMKLRDETGYAYYDTPLRQAMVLQILENNIDEEMRILYVAMTRARKRLIITANDDKIEKLQQDCMTDAEFMSPYVFAVNPAYIKWILTALYNHGDDECYMINCIDEIETVQPTEAIQEVVEIDNGLIEDYKSLIKKRFDFKYPHTNAVKLPAKLSVSELHRSYMREDDEVVTVAEPDISDFTMPKFMSDVAESTTPAERGTATHVFMQFCDFAHIEKKGIEAEIARLVAEKFINERDAGLINKTQIKRFFASQLYYRMNRAEKVWRETRFNIKYPAGDEYILVQGVIDCFFLERGKLILVDYKTDACGKDTLIERHSAQLSYYKTACKRLTGLDVFKTYIYSFHLNDSIELL